MHPWLWEHPPISTYGMCIVAGIVFAWVLARRTAGRAGVERSRIDLLVPVVMGAGLAGAYGAGWMEGEGGTVLLGALLLATGAGIVFAVMSGIRLGVLGDVCAAGVAAGIAFGRVGCFFAGCCYGEPSGQWPGVVFPRGSFAFEGQVGRGLILPGGAEALAVHPVQLYEAGLCAALAVVLMAWIGRRRVSGERFLWLGIGYGVIRFLTEMMRGDNQAVMRGMTFSQVMSVGVVGVCAGTMVVRRRMAGKWGLLITNDK